MKLLLSLSLLVLSCTTAGAADFKFADGDRVVLLGNTLIERAQRHGYWELALTALHPDKNITFRNLGWSGDTVWGEARASFAGKNGVQYLKDHLASLKPTVIVLGYGFNESFAGPEGLPRFEKGLDALLDMLATAKARIVILGPPRQEDLGRPLPDPTENNKNIRLYTDVLRKVAEKRGHAFVDFYELIGDNSKTPWTDNGIHLTPYGYWRSTAAVEKGLGLLRPHWQVNVDKDGKATADGAKVAKVQAGPVRFEVTAAVLPLPPMPADAPKGTAPLAEQLLRVQGLAAGKYTLHVDGKPVVTATASEWAAGVKLTRGPEFDQSEKLRALLIDKNQTYFHRWRPQNETYLFGFRKNEQGQNAKEIPQFDPLVEKLEEEIAKLRVPAAHEYELRPEK